MDLVLPNFAFRESDFTEVDVELGQEFPWPGTLGARTRAAQAVATSRTQDTEARRRDLVVRTAELYYQLRNVVTAVAVVGRQDRLLATVVEVATSRYSTGAVQQTEPLQARVARARLAAEAQDLVAEEAQLRAQLAALRGRTVVDSFAVLPFELPHLHLLPVIPDRVDFSHHPRVAAQLALESAANETAHAEALAGRPDFAISARYGARPIASDFFSAFVGIRVPLWAGRKQGRLADAARADAAAARADASAATVALAADLHSARARVAADEARLKLLIEQILPASRAAEDAALRSYRVGQGGFIELLSAEDTRYRVELEASATVADHLAHLVMLEQLLVPEEGV